MVDGSAAPAGSGGAASVVVGTTSGASVVGGGSSVVGGGSVVGGDAGSSGAGVVVGGSGVGDGSLGGGTDSGAAVAGAEVSLVAPAGSVPVRFSAPAHAPVSSASDMTSGNIAATGEVRVALVLVIVLLVAAAPTYGWTAGLRSVPCGHSMARRTASVAGENGGIATWRRRRLPGINFNYR